MEMSKEHEIFLLKIFPSTLQVRLAYDSGINFFDLSDLHSGPRAEIEMGNILKKTNWKRMTYVIAVKIYWSSK